MHTSYASLTVCFKTYIIHYYKLFQQFVYKKCDIRTCGLLVGVSIYLCKHFLRLLKRG